MNIIIIDDEPVICNGISAMISSIYEKWEIKGIYSDSEEALESCDWDNIQLLLTDINMPGIDGLSLVDILREREYDTQVIFISGYTEFEYAQHAIQQQAVDYIIKPVSKDKLIKALSKAEQNFTEKEKRLKDALFFQSNLIHYQRQFLEDYMFETKKFSKEEYEAKVKNFKLDDKSFKLFLFTSHKVKEKMNYYLKDILGNEVVFFLFGKEYLYSLLVIEENKNKESKVDKFEHLKETGICLQFNGKENIRDVFVLPLLYNDLLVQIKNNVSILYPDMEINMIDMFDETWKESSVPVKKTIEYIQKNYSKALSLQIISDEAYVHPTYLSNLFKKQVGYSIVDYINCYRIKMAKDLLKEAQNKVYWVSEQVGFVNQRYFSQVFKKMTGLTPAQYKQNMFLNQDKE